jgi:hypothetical protein
MTFASARGPRRAALALSTTALLWATTAHAGTVEPELGWGYATSANFAGTGDNGFVQWGLGYTLDNGIGVRVLGMGYLDFDMLDGLGTTPRTVKDFIGLQVMDHLALADQWSAMLGAGLGQTHYDLHGNAGTSHESEGIVSVGLAWKPAQHFALSLQYSYLTQSGVSNTALMCQVPF